MSADGLRHHDEVLVMMTRRNLLALAWYDLDVVVRGTPSFPDQVREEGRRLIETTHGWGGVTSHIIEVEGFAGTATRMFLSTMLLMGRGRASNQRVFARAPEGCAWLANVLSRVENPWSVAELEQAYGEVRAIAPR
jgi:hypothetical protein